MLSGIHDGPKVGGILPACALDCCVRWIIAYAGLLRKGRRGGVEKGEWTWPITFVDMVRKLG